MKDSTKTARGELFLNIHKNCSNKAKILSEQIEYPVYDATVQRIAAPAKLDYGDAELIDTLDQEGAGENARPEWRETRSRVYTVESRTHAQVYLKT